MKICSWSIVNDCLYVLQTFYVLLKVLQHMSSTMYRMTRGMLTFFCFLSICLCMCLASVGLHEFDTQKNHEVNEFRAKMRSFCEEKAQERQLLPWHQWMLYNFPCDLEPFSPVAQSGKSQINVKKIFINVKFEASEVSQCGLWVRTFFFHVPYHCGLINFDGPTC